MCVFQLQPGRRLDAAPITRHYLDSPRNAMGATKRRKSRAFSFPSQRIRKAADAAHQ